MINQRTNETRRINDLISLAMPFNVLLAPSNNKQIAISLVEEGEPAGSKDLRSYSSSHQLNYQNNVRLSTSIRSANSGPTQRDKVIVNDNSNVAAA